MDLKVAYFQAKHQNTTSGSNPSSLPHFDLLNEMLCQRPTASDHGLDVGYDALGEKDDDGGESGNEQNEGKPDACHVPKC